MSGLELRAVTAETWRSVAALEVSRAQRRFVAEPSYYLALCCYGRSGWQPLAIHLRERVIGLLMWTADPADGACWLGGFFIDGRHQRRGYGRQALGLALEQLRQRGFGSFALSYQPENLAAKALYASLGFVESGELEGDEVVARCERRAR